MTEPDFGRNDRRPFPVVATFFSLLMFAGFARTFYLHALFHMAAPSPFLQFHGALMTGWIVLFLVQSLLISNRRLVWHKQLGVIGLTFAALIISIGCVATLGAAQREVRAHSAFVPGQLNVLGLELMQLLLFGCFISAAALLRRHGDSHKRLMLVGTLCILPNAIVRLSLLTSNAFLTTNFGILLRVDPLRVERRRH